MQCKIILILFRLPKSFCIRFSIISRTLFSFCGFILCYGELNGTSESRINTKMDVVHLKEISKYKLNDEQNLFNYRLLLKFEASQIHFEDIYLLRKDQIKRCLNQILFSNGGRLTNLGKLCL